MSGGAFEYKDSSLMDELYPNSYNYKNSSDIENVFEDKEVSELMYDALSLIHDLDYYLSGDTSKDDYNKKLNFFKDKWMNNQNNNKNTIVISAFPACGKSYLKQNITDLKILDSDSSNFHRNGKLDVDWYIGEHVKNIIGRYDYIFVSSHLEVRRKLEKENIKFVTVYPDIHSKRAFLLRMYKRGNNKKFLNLLNKNWNKWVKNIEKEPHGEKIIYLKWDEYLSDVLDKCEI